MKLQDVYDKFWDKPLTIFEDYDRNLVLADLIPITTQSPQALDLGCGDGAVSKWLLDRGYPITSLDFNELALSKARTRGLPNVLLGDAEKPLPFADETFDLVFWGDVIEHVFDSEGVLREIHRVLKKGGEIVMSCPNVSYLRFRIDYLFQGRIANLDTVYEEPWDRQHIRFLNTADLKRLLQKNGFKFIRLVGVNRIWHSRLLVKFFPKLLGYIQVVKAVKL